MNGSQTLMVNNELTLEFQQIGLLRDEGLSSLVSHRSLDPEISDLLVTRAKWLMDHYV